MDWLQRPAKCVLTLVYLTLQHSEKFAVSSWSNLTFSLPAVGLVPETPPAEFSPNQ